MTEYRSTERARQHRKASLEGELKELRQRLDGEAAMRGRAQEIEAELARIDAENTTPDAWLDNLKVAAPCKESWDDMTGDERMRHCARCDKRVVNLSGMRRDEAAALLQEPEKRICVRLRKRRDGKVVFGDCGPGIARRRRQLVLASGVAAASSVLGLGLVAAGIGGAAAIAGVDKPLGHHVDTLLGHDDDDDYMVMGEMAPADYAPPATNDVVVPGEDDISNPGRNDSVEGPVRDTSRIDP